MRLAVTSRSFRQMLVKNQIRFTDIIPAARKFGFTAIEFDDLPVPDNTSEYDFALQISERCREYDIEPVVYRVDSDFMLAFGGDVWAETERVKIKADIAKILGCKGLCHGHALRLPDYNQYGWSEVTRAIAKPIRAVAEYAEKLSLKTMSSNKGNVFYKAERLTALMRTVNSENYGILADPANNLFFDNDPLDGFASLMPHCFHVYIKDFLVKPGNVTDPGAGWSRTSNANFIRGTIPGHGCVPIVQQLYILKNYGYTGDICLDYEGCEDLNFALKEGFNNISRYMKEVL